MSCTRKIRKLGNIGSILLQEQSLSPRHSLTKRITEVRVSGRGVQVRVPYLLQNLRHPIGLEREDAAVTKCVQTARLQPERHEDQLQLAPHVMSGVWFPASGLKHS